MSGDQWRESLDGHLSALSDAAMHVFGEWFDAPADQPEKLMHAARSITSSGTTSACLAGLSVIESWLCEQHNRMVEAFAKENDVPLRHAWLMHSDAWLSDQIRSDIQNAAQATGRARDACIAFAEFVERNSGVMGFAKNALIGALNPIEGLAALFGESSMDEEGRRLNAALDVAFGEVDNSTTALIHAVDTAVVTRWNTTTVGVLNAIEEEAYRRSTPSQATSTPESATLTGPRTPLLGARWAAALALVLALTGGSWIAYAFIASRSTGDAVAGEVPAGARPVNMGILVPGELRAGPGQAFDVVGMTEKPTASQILDDTVPDWLKVRTADGRDGWVARDRLAD